MNLQLIYLFTFFISGFLLFILKNDIKKFKLKIYDEINNKLWIKLYCIISIIFIHLLWVSSVLLLDVDDKLFIYGFPMYLIIPYCIYAITDLSNNEENTITAEKLDKILNVLMSLYLICIIILIAIPNIHKKNLVIFIKSILEKLFLYFFSKNISD